VSGGTANYTNTFMAYTGTNLLCYVVKINTQTHVQNLEFSKHCTGLFKL